ncbi:MAG: hypothetical protein JRD89_12225 [Deltaproteobacteria bacterium]|nr:hypothetical protein [Deltaproteobacteria bacterium]
MINATGKEIEVQDGQIVIGEDTVKIKPGEVYVFVTGQGKKDQKQYVHRINEKAVDMGTLTGVKIVLLAVGPKKTVKKKEGA